MNRKAIEDRIFFVSCIIEKYKMEENISGDAAVKKMKKCGALSWLYDHFEFLHTESEDNVIHEMHELFAI